KILALNQAHVDIQPTLDLAVVVDRKDVRLVQPGSKRRLRPKTRLELRISGQSSWQPLDRHLAALHRVERAVDLTHPAPTDQAIEPVRSEHLPRHRRLSDDRCRGSRPKVPG